VEAAASGLRRSDTARGRPSGDPGGNYVGRGADETGGRGARFKIVVSAVAPSRKLKPVEILQPYLATGVGTRHGSNAGRSLQPDSRVA
jgi:hypothetical protein